MLQIALTPNRHQATSNNHADSILTRVRCKHEHVTQNEYNVIHFKYFVKLNYIKNVWSINHNIFVIGGPGLWPVNLIITSITLLWELLIEFIHHDTLGIYIIKWNHFPRYWPFVPVNSRHKGQWRGALMFSLICAWINDWVNNREAGDLRCHRGYFHVNVMSCKIPIQSGGEQTFLGSYLSNFVLFVPTIAICFPFCNVNPVTWFPLVTCAPGLLHMKTGIVSWVRAALGNMSLAWRTLWPTGVDSSPKKKSDSWWNGVVNERSNSNNAITVVMGNIDPSVWRFCGQRTAATRWKPIELVFQITGILFKIKSC